MSRTTPETSESLPKPSFQASVRSVFTATAESSSVTVYAADYLTWKQFLLCWKDSMTEGLTEESKTVLMSDLF